MKKLFVFALLVVLILSALAGCAPGNPSTTPSSAGQPTSVEMSEGQKDGMDMSESGEKSPAVLEPVMSANMLFRVQATSQLDPLAINELHSWILHVEMADGKPVEDAVITVDGGMPAHNHGLPTEPQVTEYLGDGNYKLEGMKFSMPGLWEIRLTIQSGDVQDTVVLELTL